MTAHNVQLLDHSRRVVAVGRVTAEEGRYVGELDLRSMPPSLRRTFQDYEEIVNGQIFGLLDDIEERIEDLAIKVVFDDGREARVEDLQIYPSTGLASFKVASLTETRPTTRK
jgi:hypothetical protein